MNSSATDSRQTRAIVLTLAIVAAGISLLASSRYGPQVTPDSVAYISAATSLVSEGEYNSFDRPYYRWPPLYPTLLAVAKILEVDLVAAARFINVAALVGVVLAAWSLFDRHIPDRRLALAALFAVVVSTPIHIAAVSIWSEILFILISLLFLLSLIRFLSDPDVWWLMLVSLLACCAVMQRYAGVTVVVTGAIAILFLDARSSLWKRLFYLAAFSALSMIPLALWVLRNYSLSGSPIGVRGPSGFSATEVLHFYLQTVIGWYVPREFLSRPVLLIVGITGIALGAFMAVVWRRKRSLVPPIPASVWPVVLFAGVYSSFIIGSSIVFSYDRINSRILAPLSVYVVFFGFVGIQAVSTLTGGAKLGGRGEILRKSLVVLMIAFALVGPLTRTWSFTAASLAEGAGGYNSTLWRESEAMAWLRAAPEEGVIHSNAPSAVLFLTGRPAKWSPRGAVSSLPRPPIGVLWFDSVIHPHLHDPDAFEAFYHVEVVRRFEDGTFYSLSSRD